MGTVSFCYTNHKKYWKNKKRIKDKSENDIKRSFKTELPVKRRYSTENNETGNT
jgi:hypothetical protein